MPFDDGPLAVSGDPNKNSASGNDSASGYDRLARWYGALEWLMFGGALAKARVALSNQINDPKRALVLGDGTGKLLWSLCRSYPNCDFVSVDQSEKMLLRQKRRLLEEHAIRVEWICADAMNFEANRGEFDLMVAAFFLDCFSNKTLDENLPKLLGWIRNGGQFYFVDFIDSDEGKSNRIAKTKLAAMHLFFRWTTDLENNQLPDWESLFENQEIELMARSDSHLGMITTRVYTVQREDHKRSCPSDR